jgi:hypothetical protein
MKTNRTRLQIRGLIVLAFLALSIVPAQASTFNLTSQFSQSSNPNGVWSYNMSGSPIIAPLNTGYGAGWGYFPSADASILQATSAVDGHDWQVGDVVMHAPSVPYGGPTTFLDIDWRSPANGTISISGSAWDAAFYDGRDANWWLSVGGTTIASRGSVFGLYRSDPAAQFSSNLLPAQNLTGIGVTAGEVVRLGVATDTYYGHFVGVTEEITLTEPVPDYSPNFLMLAISLVLITLRQRAAIRA